MALKQSFKAILNSTKCVPVLKNYRFMSLYPVNDDIYGLTSEQKQVR